MEPELGARVRYRGRTATVTQKLVANIRRHGSDRSPAGSRYLVLFLAPDAGGRGEELRLYEPDWDDLEPIAE